jgi:hypothetical protein
MTRLVRGALAAGAIGMLLYGGWVTSAQQTTPAPAAGSGRAGANVDLTGYWVSFVTEDWRFRMVTPPEG